VALPGSGPQTERLGMEEQKKHPCRSGLPTFGRDGSQENVAQNSSSSILHMKTSLPSLMAASNLRLTRKSPESFVKGTLDLITQSSNAIKYVAPSSLDTSRHRDTETRPERFSRKKITSSGEIAVPLVVPLRFRRQQEEPQGPSKPF
jgi:hypothetical protein